MHLIISPLEYDQLHRGLWEFEDPARYENRLNGLFFHRFSRLRWAAYGTARH